MRFPFAVHAETPVERLVRTVALLAVVALVAWAFWYNNQRLAEKINGNREFWDETGEMTGDDVEFVRQFIKAMREQFSVRAIIQVRKGDPEPPASLEPGDFFLGLSPARQKVMVQLPDGRGNEDDRNFVRAVEQEVFRGDWKNWPHGLKTSLVMAWDLFSGKAAETPAGVSRIVQDQTGKLTKADQLALEGYAKDLAGRFGLTLRVEVLAGPLPEPPSDPLTLYVGLSPLENRARLVFPAVLERAVGKDLRTELEQTVLQPSLSGDHWPEALRTALGRVWKELSGEDRPW